MCNKGDKYTECPNIIGFNKYTPYKSFTQILKDLT